MTAPIEILLSHLKDFIVFSSCIVLVTAFYIVQYYFGKCRNESDNDMIEIVQEKCREIPLNDERNTTNQNGTGVSFLEPNSCHQARRKKQVISEITVKKIYLPRRLSQKRQRSKNRSDQKNDHCDENGLYEDENANKTVWTR